MTTVRIPRPANTKLPTESTTIRPATGRRTVRQSNGPGGSAGMPSSEAAVPRPAIDGGSPHRMMAMTRKLTALSRNATARSLASVRMMDAVAGPMTNAMLSSEA